MTDDVTADHHAAIEPPPVAVRVDWRSTTGTSRTTLTTHLWTAPPLGRGSPIHGEAFAALRELDADLVRFLPWFSHPRLAVPALTPPTDTGTSWDFELLDPIVEDFMAAAKGRPVVANFATIPAWMFATAEPVAVPEDPDAIQWDYEQGTELRDPTLTEVADYFYRVASWYIAGGGFVTADGTRKLLLVNKTAHPVAVVLSGDTDRGSNHDRHVQQVSAATGAGDAATTPLTDDGLTLDAYATAVLTL